MGSALWHTATTRPYVMLFLAAFLVLSWCEQGGRRTGLWLLIGTAVGWASESLSIATGVPFGHYRYHAANFPREAWIGAVPLFASLSFAFLSYFACSAAARIREAIRPGAARGIAGTTALAAAIGAWMDAVIDPVTLRGRYWFLGDLYHYDGAGIHFGVPAANYAGWIVTVGAIVLANQLAVRALEARGVRLTRGPRLPFERLWGALCCTGVLAFMLVVNLALWLRNAGDGREPWGAMLASGALLSSAFVALWLAALGREPSPVSTAPTAAPARGT